MGQKLHAAPAVQLLLNAVMPWAEERLREAGGIPAAAAWLAPGPGDTQLRIAPDAESSLVQEQEARLREQMRALWREGAASAVALVAPVVYRKASSAESSLAVRLHIETRGEMKGHGQSEEFCADILMPYRIRAGRGWRGGSRNRVHFSHPVAQESDSWFGDSRSGGDEPGSRA